MRPIGQTFFIHEPAPPSGAAGVYVTRIDVYFKTISDTFGVECQIRTVENGVPTAKRLPFASKIISVGDQIEGRDALQISTDGSKSSIFKFDTPVFLESNKQYAFVIAPCGGDPEYNIFTSVQGNNDLISGGAVTKNNDTGDLFLSSNDLAWLPVINEDLKFQIYTANFTATSGTAYFNSPAEEIIVYKDPVESFEVRETIVYGSGYYNYTVLNISSNTGAFNTGDLVYQSNGVANVGTGIVYSSNTSIIKLANTTGAFYTAYQIKDFTTSANAVVSGVSQNVSSTLGSNTITVPDSTQFATNQVIYVQENGRDQSQVVKITSKPSNTVLQVNSVMHFTDTNCLYGGLIANGTFTTGFSGSSFKDDHYVGIFDRSTANSTVNLYGVSNVQMIGLITGASANLIGIVNFGYESVTTNFNSLTVANTTLDFAFTGFKSGGGYSTEGYNNIQYGQINEIIDTPRISMSRSNEFGQLSGARIGNHSVILKSIMQTGNNKVTPVIDTVQTNITYTHNSLLKDYQTKGAILNIDMSGNNFYSGDLITQNTYSQTGYTNSVASGIVGFSNSSLVILSNTTGYFISNAPFTSKTSNSSYVSDGFSGNVVTAQMYSESDKFETYTPSKYISKNVVLAAGQDSEDILVYTTAHRPANTNLNVYVTVKNNQDTELLSSKAFTRLKEISPSSLTSSKVKLDDYVELVHGFYQSQNIFLSGTTIDNTSNTITCQSTQGITNNSFIYTGISNTSVSLFNVRQVVHVLNSTSFTVDSTPSFSSLDATLGIIPGIENRQSAFLYDQNNNILRYCTSADAVYDSYIQFALKVVFVSDSTAVVPLMVDIRAIALQV